jgi:histidinol-phosphate aminotransferase
VRLATADAARYGVRQPHPRISGKLLPMSVTFAEKLARIPGYQAGVPTGQAPEAIAAGGIAQLASNESPVPPHPKVINAIREAAGVMNRYPDPDATRLRRRIAERYETEPGRVAVGNGSCEILLAAAEALCEPGAEVLYAWPSFSMYPHLAALTGAREVRVPLGEGEVHDLDAMAAEVTAATQLAIVCNPNNPTGTHLPAAQVADFCARIPTHVTIALDEAYIEFQTVDDPDTTVDLLADFPNLVVLRTFSKVYGLAGLRVGFALGSAKFRAAVDAVRQPFSVNALAQAAAAEAILHQDDVEQRVERTLIERVRVEEGLRELGLSTTETQTNFSWIDLGDADEKNVVASLAEHSIAVRPGTPLGGPGHIRVSYGTPAENDRFLAALSEILA